MFRIRQRLSGVWQKIRKNLLTRHSQIIAGVIFMIFLLFSLQPLYFSLLPVLPSVTMNNSAVITSISSAGDPTTASGSQSSGSDNDPATSQISSGESGTNISGSVSESSSGPARTEHSETATVSGTTADETDAITVTIFEDDFDTLFVAQNGPENSDGSRERPFRTIQAAIEEAAPGNRIIILAGIYDERLDFTGKKKLTIAPAAGERVVLSGHRFTDGYLINIAYAEAITISGLQIKDFRGDDLECVMIRKGSRDISIEKCSFSEIGLISENGNAHVILAKGDSKTPLRNISIIGNEIYSCYTGRSEAVTMESNVDGFSICDNIIHDISNIAVDATGFYANGVDDPDLNQARNGLICDNLIYNIFSPYASCAAIYIDGGRDILVSGNVIYDSMYGIEVGCEQKYDEENPSWKAAAANIAVRYNIIYNCSKAGLVIGGYDMPRTGFVRDCLVEQNTFYKNNKEIELSYCVNIKFKKNIIFGSGNERYYIYHYVENELSGFNSDQNIFYTDQGAGRFKLYGLYADNLADWQQISDQDINSQMADPQFVSPQTGDFRLKEGSPAAGYGA